MLNIFLINKLDEVFGGLIRCHNYFSIIDESTCTVVLLVTDICLIYSTSFNKEVIPLLSAELEFHRFLRYTFAGSKQTIEELLKYNKSKYYLQKHLIIYNCYETLSNFVYSEGSMQLASHGDIDTLIHMNISFRLEYNGEIVNYLDAKAFIFSGIKKENLYVWENKSQLCAIAQVIHRTETDYPEIGHVFTITNHRKNGYAATLVHCLTNKLLNEKNKKCMLYTHGDNLASNKAFLKIGYKQIGEYIMCYKEK